MQGQASTRMRAKWQRENVAAVLGMRSECCSGRQGPGLVAPDPRPTQPRPTPALAPQRPPPEGRLPPSPASLQHQEPSKTQWARADLAERAGLRVRGPAARCRGGFGALSDFPVTPVKIGPVSLTGTPGHTGLELSLPNAGSSRTHSGHLRPTCRCLGPGPRVLTPRLPPGGVRAPLTPPSAPPWCLLPRTRTVAHMPWRPRSLGSRYLASSREPRTPGRGPGLPQLLS